MVFSDEVSGRLRITKFHDLAGEDALSLSYCVARFKSSRRLSTSRRKSSIMYCILLSTKLFACLCNISSNDDSSFVILHVKSAKLVAVLSISLFMAHSRLSGGPGDAAFFLAHEGADPLACSWFRLVPHLVTLRFGCVLLPRGFFVLCSLRGGEAK